MATVNGNPLDFLTAAAAAVNASSSFNDELTSINQSFDGASCNNFYNTLLSGSNYVLKMFSISL